MSTHLFGPRLLCLVQLKKKRKENICILFIESSQIKRGGVHKAESGQPNK